MSVHEGGCLCGAVRYATHAQPLRVHIYMFLEAAQNGTLVPAGFNTFHGSHTLNDGTPAVPTVYDEPHTVRRG